MFPKVSSLLPFAIMIILPLLIMMYSSDLALTSIAQGIRDETLQCEENSINITDSLKYNSNFKDYNHSFGLRVNLPYPSDWQVSNGITYFIVAPPSPAQFSDVIFIMTALPSGNKQLEEVVGIDVNKFKQNSGYFTKFNLTKLNKTSVTNADLPAYELVFSIEGSRGPVNATLIYTISGNKIYTIYYQASPDKYCKYLPTIENMIDSMKIHGIEDVETIRQSGIMIGASPIDLAINPLTNKLYVAASDSDKIYVIDGFTNNVISNITVGVIPNTIAINHITNTIYVASPENDIIYVIDGFANKLTNFIRAGPAVGDIAIDNNEFGGSGSLIYVTNSGDNTLSVIATNKNINKTILVREAPFAVAVDPTINKVYVANSLNNTISIIEYITHVYGSYTYNISHVPVGTFPTGVAADPLNDHSLITRARSLA